MQDNQFKPAEPTEPQRLLPRDMTASGTLPGTTDISINDPQVKISGRNRAFIVNNTAGSPIVTLGRSGSSYGLFVGSTNLYGAGSSGQILTSNGASAAPTWEDAATPAQYTTLLGTGSGTTTSVAAENVDTIAISGLTALDTLMVYFSFSSITQDTDVPQLYSTTDSGILTYLNETGAAATADLQYFGDALIMTTQHDSTVYNAVSRLVKPTAAGGNDASPKGFGKATDLSTAFTGSWTLAFRHGGVTAGGTLRWSWRVYRLAGQ